MPTEPAMSGEIPPDGVLDILREIEAKRVTGRIRFTSVSESGQSQTGEVELIAGQLAMDQDPLPDGTDPVERMLALRRGHYVVHQRLPTLAISQGDDRQRSGSLAVHVPADLMNYCEQAGLTGTLTLEKGRERIELVYEHGELLAIRVDGREDGDLSHVFAWDDGTFRIAVNSNARTLVPELSLEEEQEDDPVAREPTTQFVRPRTDDTGSHFLKVFEVALTEIVDQRERGRPSSRTSPANASVRPRTAPTANASSPKKVREPTVRVVYLKPDDPTSAFVPDDRRTRHAAAGAGGREEALPDAAPTRRRERDASSAHDSGKRRSSAGHIAATPQAPLAPRSNAGPIAWVIAVIAIGILVLLLLFQLPGAP